MVCSLKSWVNRPIFSSCILTLRSFALRCNPHPYLACQNRFRRIICALFPIYLESWSRKTLQSLHQITQFHQTETMHFFWTTNPDGIRTLLSLRRSGNQELTTTRIARWGFPLWKEPSPKFRGWRFALWCLSMRCPSLKPKGGHLNFFCHQKDSTDSKVKSNYMSNDSFIIVFGILFGLICSNEKRCDHCFHYGMDDMYLFPGFQLFHPFGRCTSAQIRGFFIGSTQIPIWVSISDDFWMPMFYSNSYKMLQ